MRAGLLRKYNDEPVRKPASMAVPQTSIGSVPAYHHTSASQTQQTLPTAPVEKLALMRLDGDLYASTIDSLVHLYPKLSPGGFCIIDDYYSFEECAQAVDEYRREHAISAPLVVATYHTRCTMRGKPPARLVPSRVEKVVALPVHVPCTPHTIVAPVVRRHTLAVGPVDAICMTIVLAINPTGCTT